MVSISFRNVLIASAAIIFYVTFMFGIDKFKNLTSNKNWANKRAKNYKLFGHFDHNFETKRNRELFLATLPSFGLLFRQKQHHLRKTTKQTEVRRLGFSYWLLLWLSTIWFSIHGPEAEFLSATEELSYIPALSPSFLSLWDDASGRLKKVTITEPPFDLRWEGHWALKLHQLK